MNLCSSGATASTTSLSSTGQAERSGGGGVAGGGGISNGGGGGGGVTGSGGGGGGNTSDGLSEATHCFGGSGGGATASGPEETINAISPANGGGASGAQQPSGSNGQLHNENNAIMPPETRPKMVTVKHPESNKPKPTTKKSKPIQADQDVIKALQRCRDEGKCS